MLGVATLSSQSDLILDLNASILYLLQVVHLKTTLIILNLGLTHKFMRILATHCLNIRYLELVVHLLFNMLWRSNLHQVLLVLGSRRNTQ